MIIGTLIAHRVSLYIADADTEEPSIADIIMSKVPSPSSKYIQIQVTKKKIQGFFAIFGFVTAFCISIPIFISSSSQSSVTVGITIIVGIVLCTLIILLFLDLKSYLRQFGQTLISFFLGCCWLFFLIPFVCLIPVTLSSTTSSAEIESITS